MCTATICGIPGALRCTREPGHTAGHVFAASDVPDRHAATEGVDS